MRPPAPGASREVRTFADLARLKRREAGLVVAPHPFFQSSTSLMGRLNRHADLFDAVEYNAMHTASLNFIAGRQEPSSAAV